MLLVLGDYKLRNKVLIYPCKAKTEPKPSEKDDILKEKKVSKDKMVTHDNKNSQ